MQAIHATPHALTMPESPNYFRSSSDSRPSPGSALSPSSTGLTPLIASHCAISSLEQFISQSNPTREDLVILDFYGTLSEELKKPDNSVPLLEKLLSQGVHVIICTSEPDHSPILRILESHGISLTSRIGDTEVPHGILSAVSKGLGIRQLLQKSGRTFERAFLLDDTAINLSLAEKILHGSPTKFSPLLYTSSSPDASSPSTIALSPAAGRSPSQIEVAVAPTPSDAATSPPAAAPTQTQQAGSQETKEKEPSCFRRFFCCWCKA